MAQFTRTRPSNSGAAQTRAQVKALQSESLTNNPLTNTISSGVNTAEDVIGGAASAVGSVVDFLKMAAWLVHPLNWLRMAEALWGTMFMLIGLYVSVRSDRRRMMRQIVGRYTPIGRGMSTARRASQAVRSSVE